MTTSLDIPSWTQKANNIVSYIWVHRDRFYQGFFLALLRTIVVAPFPWIFKYMVDDLIPQKEVSGILMLALLFVAMLGLHYYFSVTGAQQIGKALSELVLELRAQIFFKLQFINFGYLDRQQTGKLLSKYAFDTQKVEQVLMQILNQFLPNSLYSLSVLLILISMNWRLSVVVIFFLPIYYLARTHFFTEMKTKHHEARKAQEKLTGTASELINALRLVRSFGEEKQAQEQLRATSEHVAWSRVNLISVNSRFGTFGFVSGQFLGLVVIAGGAILAIYEGVTLGTLLAFMAALPILTMPIQLFTQISHEYFIGQESLRSIRELLDSRYVEGWDGKNRFKDMKGDVVFDKISFQYDGTDRHAIHELSLHIKPGEHVAFVGPSGSGKSTLANLLLGLYQPDEGEIRIDDNAQKDINMRWFRRKVAIVMQESLLLSGSVADNIRFARPNATDQEIREAAKFANAHEFIEELDDGYNTRVGERGAMLSGGQRQRISIARSILRDPRILILDEATSALDYKSESLIQEALERLAEGRTVITIAHRLSTIRRADRIVVLHYGKIVEEGSFEELSKQKGPFSKLLEANKDEDAVHAA